MSATDTSTAEDLVRETLRVYDAQEFDRLGEVLADDFEVRVAGGSFKGHDEVRGMLNAFYGAFPDLTHHVETMGSIGNLVAAQLRVTVTHDGPFHSAAGIIEPTGRSFEWRSGNFVTVGDGKLKSWDIYLDQVGILQSVGYVLTPA